MTMKPNIIVSQLRLPLLAGPVRFAVGSPDGLTSNAWRMWTGKQGDIYLACRDNFKEAKVSLHVSGRWRMGFTTEAICNDPKLSQSTNRAWEVWDEPPESLPDTVVAFKLIFPTAELVIRPEQRPAKQWEKVIHIESAPPGKVTILTLFVTNGMPTLNHESEPSFCIASLAIGKNRYAQLIVHTESSDGLDALIENGVVQARKLTEAAGVSVPQNGYLYLFGKQGNGCRYIIGARANRET